MRIRIEITKDHQSLILENEGLVVDKISDIYYHDLDSKLIEGLAFLIRKYSIGLNDISDYTIVCSLGQESTSSKIVEAFVEGLCTAKNGEVVANC